MSRKNKVNPDHYKVAGRLAPDDLARERMKQGMAKTATDWDERMKGSTGRGDEGRRRSAELNVVGRMTPVAPGRVARRR